MNARSIYVASSWRNAYYPAVVTMLRELGHKVYDFRNPPDGNGGFHWTDIDAHAMSWTPEQYRAALRHPLAQAGFAQDFGAMKAADTCLLVLPAGRSASWELGWMDGAGKDCLIYLPEPIEPELMYGGGGQTRILISTDELVKEFTIHGHA